MWDFDPKAQLTGSHHIRWQSGIAGKGFVWASSEGRAVMTWNVAENGIPNHHDILEANFIPYEQMESPFEIAASGSVTIPPQWERIAATSYLHELERVDPRLSAEMPWGQDWNDWQSMKPAYKGGGHHLGFDPEVHQQGKGFITDDGSVWTWPTEQNRPQHMEYDMKLKKQGLGIMPGTAFHIKPTGSIWQFGEGRNLTPEHKSLIQNADPRLNFNTQEDVWPGDEWTSLS